ncbi:MAG TPA: MazG-like family protein [Candidatus Nanoarchaeia archaeon]|nr:MazG-like family protein [Candidatus Nanoarchaeia archaeon]
MKIKELQNKIAEFDNARGWENSWNVKDLMLNMSEEIGELWNLIKWVDDEKQKELVEKNKEEVENFIGDVLFLIIKIANQAKIDVDKSIQDVLNEYEKRMPPEIMKKLKHANKKAGGFDEKDGN